MPNEQVHHLTAVITWRFILTHLKRWLSGVVESGSL